MLKDLVKEKDVQVSNLPLKKLQPVLDQFQKFLRGSTGEHGYLIARAALTLAGLSFRCAYSGGAHEAGKVGVIEINCVLPLSTKDLIQYSIKSLGAVSIDEPVANEAPGLMGKDV